MPTGNVGSLHRRPRIAVAALAAAVAFLLSACTVSDSGSEGGASGQEGRSVQPDADSTLAAQVPDEYKDGVVAVYDPQYPPSYFVDEDGEVAGYVIDLQDAISAKLGVEITIEQAKFDGIITGMQGGRYDTSFFHDTPDRREQLHIVDMHQTGSSVLLQQGNPSGIDLHGLCGKSVGVTKGGQQSLELLPVLNSECADAGEEEISESIFAGPNEGSLALKSGRIDGWLGDAPYNGYVVKQDPQSFELSETVDLSGVSGFAFRQDDPLVDLFEQAAIEIMNDGTYADILKDWEMTDLAMDEPTINGE